MLNYRDLFRKLKSNRIAHHNQIDASELRTQELYARELELEHKKDKSLKEKIERWQLIFYKNLCEHHTDLLKAFHSFFIMLGIFGFLNSMVIVLFWFFIKFNFSNLYFVENIYNAHIVFLIEKYIWWVIEFDILLLFIHIALIAYLLLSNSLLSNILRYFFIICGYLTGFVIMIISPKLIIPALGFFSNGKNLLDPLSVIGGIYTLSFALVAYSFVKTARKNSIVPS
ncbi:hypothetical protein H2279_02795 [Campylobacter sp. B0100352/1]|uniref:hypothetical protein n=1 Tax=Campylobacter sp. B0100352/1 TaxID=2735783 RepID=UPI001E0C953D|nr:hypothetical protein [Campylobacter sp. B0100352/1]